MKICKITLSIILAVAMTVTMMPWLGGTVYADREPSGDGGTIVSNNPDNVAAVFGNHATASMGTGSDSNVMTITLSSDVTLDSAVRFTMGAAGDRVVLNLNNHTIKGTAGNNGTNNSEAQGENAIEICAAAYDVVIQGPGTIKGGKGAVYKSETQKKRGETGGMAVCFVGNTNNTYWYPQADDAELKYGLTVTDGAVLTGGDGADMTGDDWLDNIRDYDGEDRTSHNGGTQFKLTGGAGGAGIGQENARIKGKATTPCYARIDIIDGIVNGGTGGNLNLSSDNTPAMTHYGLMNNSVIDAYMQELSDTSRTYDDFVESDIEFKPGDGGTGILIGGGRKFLCVEDSGAVNGGACGSIEYGKSKLINRIHNKCAEAGNGIEIYGDVGLKNIDATLTEANWSEKTKNSGDVGVHITGTVKGGNAPDADAMNEEAGNGGNGIVLNGDDEYVALTSSLPQGELVEKWGIIEVDTNGTVSGGNGGDAVYLSGGLGGDGIAEAYSKGNDITDDSDIGTDYYLIKGTVTGGNGGSSKFGSSAAGGNGIYFDNGRKNTVVRGGGTAIGGNQGDEIDQGIFSFQELEAEAVRYYPTDREYNNNTVVLSETAGNAGSFNTVDNTGLSVAASMDPSSNPTSSTVLSCVVTKPVGYNSDVYINWTVRFDDSINGSEISDIEPSGTDSTSFNLRSNSQYKYLAYPTYANNPELGNSYNVNVATADRIVEAMGINNTTATIWCNVLLSDGRYAKSNDIVVGKGGSGEDPGGPTQEEIDQAAADRVYDMLFELPGLGSITLEDADAVAAVRAAYEALTPSQQACLEKYSFLQDLEDAENKIAGFVADLIRNLPNATDISAENVVTVEEAATTASELYDSLTERQQSIIQNDDAGDLIEKLETVIVKVDEVNQTVAGEVASLISDLEVQLSALDPDSQDYETDLQAIKAAIEDAVAAYNKLSQSQKGYIEEDINEILHNAVETYNELFPEEPLDDPTVGIAITEDMITVADGTYTGKALTPKVTVKDGNRTLTEGDDYEKQYSNNTNAGKGKVTVLGKGDYTGEASKEFTINPKKITPAVSLSSAKYTWNGKVKKPSVTVKDGKVKLATSQYTATYAAGRKNVGTYKVTVKLKGNYSGTKTANFTIVPKGATIVNPKPAKKALTAKWKKQSSKMSKSRITGYQVQYSTSKAFKSGVKTKTVKGYQKTSVKVSKLKGKKKYYVRVRTYMKTGGKTYYSGWSGAKAVKTK